MFGISPFNQFSIPAFWLVLVGLVALLCDVFLDLYLNRIARAGQPEPYARQPAAKPAPPRHQMLIRLSDFLSLGSLLALVIAAGQLPIFPSLPIAWLANRERELLLIGLVGLATLMTVLILVFELWPWWHRSVGRLRVKSYVVFGFAATGTLCVLVFLLQVPERMHNSRNVALAALVFCGGLTLYRGIRARIRAGDSWGVGLLGSLAIATQLVSMLGQMAFALTMIIIGLLWIFGLVPFPAHPIIDIQTLLDPRLPHGPLDAERASLVAGLETFALMVGLLAFLYLVLYSVRRLMSARGFSWIDPPNVRVLGPHAKYKLFTWLGSDFSIADVTRQAWLHAMVQPEPNEPFGPALEATARIEAPLNAPNRQIRFLIIGDPGEGDDSQLYPERKHDGTAKQQLLEGAADSGQATDQPDFILICSDVIYPGGELSDYERAFYRPYANADVPFYAIPGNHDWYDHLHGFFANFAYPAAHTASPLGRALKQMPWSWTPWRRLAWNSVARWRDRYGLRQVGGLPGRPETHQQLSFFEIGFGDKPLTVFALDNGVAGSIDRIQYRWLHERLSALRDARRPGFDPHHRILVLVGIPLYVDGAFSGARTPPKPRRARRPDSYGMRAIYELLRRHRVDVVMGGDTHAYQRYTVQYTANGARHEMHQIVNGGGGAYLSPPMDRGWFDVERAPGMDGASPNHQILRPQLSRRMVYSADEREHDTVTLHAIYPTANELAQKYVWNVRNTYKLPAHAGRARLRGWDQLRQRFQCWFSQWALKADFTNALDHDREPLLQSLVEVALEPDGGAYRLDFTARDANGAEIDRLSLPAGSAVVARESV